MNLLPTRQSFAGCTRLSACLCTGLPNYGQELQREDYLFAIVLAPVLRFQTAPNPHNRYFRAYHKQLVKR